MGCPRTFYNINVFTEPPQWFDPGLTVHKRARTLHDNGCAWANFNILQYRLRSRIIYNLLYYFVIIIFNILSQIYLYNDDAYNMTILIT